MNIEEVDNETAIVHHVAFAPLDAMNVVSDWALVNCEVCLDMRREDN